MHRRAFLKASFALPTIAVVSTLPRFTQANTEGAGKWRVFEVTTQVEILKPVGVTRVWLPIPLMEDTPYQKSLGNTWKAEGAMASMAQDAQSGAAFVYAEWPETVQHPTLQLTSRVATRDHTVDLTKPGTMPKADPKLLALYTEPTVLLPTDGIVRDTAKKIVKDVRGGHLEQARAVYDSLDPENFRYTLMSHELGTT